MRALLFLMRAVSASTFRIAVVAGCAAGILIPAGARGLSAVSLRFKFKAGDTYTYQTNGQIMIPMPNMGGTKSSQPNHAGKPQNTLNLPVNSTQKIVVLKVESNGYARLQIDSTGSAAMAPGQPAGAPTMTTISVTATPLGVLTSPKSTGSPTGAQALSALSDVGSIGSITVYLPARPVSPGDSWTQKVSVPQMPEMATVTAVFEKLSQVGRYKTAHIKLTLTVPVNAKLDTGAATKGNAHGEARLFGNIVMHYEDDFAIGEGRLIKSIGTGSTDITVKQSGAGTIGSPGAVKPQSAHIAAKITMSSALIQ